MNPKKLQKHRPKSPPLKPDRKTQIIMRKLLVVSLGCDKNLVDTEKMLGSLAGTDIELTDDENEAEVILVNTCCFIHDAKEESVSSIIEMSELRKSGSCKALIVAGCMAQHYGQDILDELETVDAVIGTNAIGRLNEVLERIDKGERVLYLDELKGFPQNVKKRVSVTNGLSEYLKIAEGCDKHCTYCIIPKLRGSYRSVPMEELIEEAKGLAQAGVVELNLVAQETTLYGKDIYGEKRLHVLLHELCKIEGLKWIRLLYCYPEEIYPELIETIRDEEKICNYIDMPIQHCSDAVLKRMGRRTTKQELLDVIAALREEIPDIVLRTSLIAGFPGETEEQHQEMLDFIDLVGFDRLGVFTYSREEGTPAYNMPDQLDEETKAKWRDELMALQQEISLDFNEQRIGDELDAFVEGFIPEDNIYIGRTYGDAPNVDGYVFINSDAGLNTGDIVRVRIEGASEYDLVSSVIDQED